MTQLEVCLCSGPLGCLELAGLLMHQTHMQDVMTLSADAVLDDDALNRMCVLVFLVSPFPLINEWP